MTINKFSWPTSASQPGTRQRQSDVVPTDASHDYLAAFSVQQFCDLHGIGRNLFYRMLAEGKAPNIMKIGRRTLISRESAAAWRREVEQQTSRELADRAAQSMGWVVDGSK